MEEIILATTNKGKLKEFNEMAKGLNFKFISIDMPYILEDGTTYEENSYIKASTIAKLTNKKVLADDSGLELYALSNRPGVHTSRYRNDLETYDKRCLALSDELNGKENRLAKFVCVLTLVLEDGSHLSFRGETEGEILKELKGTNGHGYDPIFYSYDLKKSFGEASLDEKNTVSHRTRAFKKFMDYMINKGGKNDTNC